MRRIEHDQQYNYQKLPDECWAKILSHLDDNFDWEALSLTSKKFLSLTNFSRISLSFHYHRLLPTTKRPESIHLFSKLLERYPNIKRLMFCPLLVQDNIDLVMPLIAQSSLNLEELDLSFNGSLQTVCLDDFVGSSFKLKVLKLWCTVTNADLIRIADTFPFLEEIRTRDNCIPFEVDGGLAVNDEGIQYLSSKLKRLRVVDLTHVYISDNSLVSLASNCVFLEHFTLCVCPKLGVPIRVTDNGIALFVRSCSNLKSLDVTGFFKMRCFAAKTSTNLPNSLQTLKFNMLDISDEFLCSITEARISLTHLHVELCKGYSFTGIWKLLNSYRSLKTLVLFSVEFLTNEHIEKLSPFLHNLTTIQLSNCPLFSDSAFVMLTQTCPLLCDIGMSGTGLGKEECEYDELSLKKNFAVKHLRLPMNNYLSTSTLRRILSICPKLEKLSLRQSFKSNDQQLDVADVLELSRELLDLDVGDCHLKFTRKDMKFTMIENLNAASSDINDEVLVELAKICPRLLHLKLIICDNVTDEGVKEVVKSCKRLRSLSIGGSENVNTDLIDWIESKYPSVTRRVSI